MNRSATRTGPDDELREIRLAFVEGHERGEPLVGWLERYPQHAAALIDLALALDTGMGGPEPDAGEVAAAAIELRQALGTVAGPPPPAPAPGLVARGRALGFSPGQLAAQLRLTSDLVIKLDRGVIQPTSVPRRLRQQLAEVLRYPLATLDTILSRPATVAAFHYAERAPEQPRRQSFAEALAGSQMLAPEDRSFWLATAREEGLAS